MSLVISKNYMEKEFFNILDDTNEAFTEAISSILKSIENTQQRVNALHSLTNQSNAKVLKIVNYKALLKEDFETCETLKIYADVLNIKNDKK